MPSAIQIRSEILARLIEHARQEPLKECCGLLAGRSALITEVIPATNAAVDPPRAYEIAPEELFKLIRKIRAAKLELLGIYHSHPSGENRPSARDIERAFYPAAAYFILSPGADVQPPVRAFSIRDGKITELEIQVK